MMAADRPGKLLIEGLSAETTEKSLEAEFEKYGHIVEVLLIKDQNTNKSKGFAFITFESPEGAKDAAKEMNGKFLDGKAIKVEQANKPSIESGSRQRLQPPARNRGHPRDLRWERGRTGGATGRVSRGGNFGPVLGRENYRGGPHRQPVSSWRDNYVSPRNNGYATKDSDHDGYGGNCDRDYSEHRTGDSYRDSYTSYGGSHGALSGRSPPLSYGRRSRYDDYSSTRDKYGGGQKSYSSSRSNTYLSSRDHGGRQKRGFPSLKDRVYPAPHESNSSSGCEASRGGHGGSRSETEGRNRY